MRRIKKNHIQLALISIALISAIGGFRKIAASKRRAAEFKKEIESTRRIRRKAEKHLEQYRFSNLRRLRQYPLRGGAHH